MGFNGAAGVNPRMARVKRTNTKKRNWLQWGRGCEPTDGTEKATGRATTIRLQWGRGCEPTDGRSKPPVRHMVELASMGPRV